MEKEKSKIQWFYLFLVIIFLLVGCSRSQNKHNVTLQPLEKTRNPGDPDPTLAANPTTTVQVAKLAVGAMYSKQLFNSYVNATGINPNDANLLTTFNETKDQLPQMGMGREVSNTSVFAVNNLAARVCSIFVINEKALTAAKRKVFGSFDFAKNQDSVTEEAVTKVADALAKIFLSRTLTELELAEVIKAKGNALDGATKEAATVQKLANLLCTAIASSAEATNL